MDISAFQMQTFINMGVDVSGFSVPDVWSDPVATDPRVLNPGITDSTPTVFRDVGFGTPTVLQTGFSAPPLAAPVPEGRHGVQAPIDPFIPGFGIDDFATDRGNEINPGEVFFPSGRLDFAEDAMTLLDPLGFIQGGVNHLADNPFNDPGRGGPDISPMLGGFPMTPGIALSRLAVAFNLIGSAVKKTNGRIPMNKGFLSRVMQVATGLTIANVLGIDLWPWNNSSDRQQVQEMVEEALESGAISDNRAYNRQTGMLSPMRAIIILYDRMGEQVEQMYAVSFRPANPATSSRRAVRSSNVVRRRRAPRRRSS